MNDALNTAHVRECAVSLGWLLTFARQVPDRYSTADVVERVVKPATATHRCRYVALSSVPPTAVGRSQLFVSHRWGCDFCTELVAAVAGHFADAAATGPQQQLQHNGSLRRGSGLSSAGGSRAMLRSRSGSEAAGGCRARSPGLAAGGLTATGFVTGTSAGGHGAAHQAIAGQPLGEGVGACGAEPHRGSRGGLVAAGRNSPAPVCVSMGHQHPHGSQPGTQQHPSQPRHSCGEQRHGARAPSCTAPEGADCNGACAACTSASSPSGIYASIASLEPNPKAHAQPHSQAPTQPQHHPRTATPLLDSLRRRSCHSPQPPPPHPPSPPLVLDPKPDPAQVLRQYSSRLRAGPVHSASQASTHPTGSCTQPQSLSSSLTALAAHPLPSPARRSSSNNLSVQPPDFCTVPQPPQPHRTGTRSSSRAPSTPHLDRRSSWLAALPGETLGSTPGVEASGWLADPSIDPTPGSAASLNPLLARPPSYLGMQALPGPPPASQPSSRLPSSSSLPNGPLQGGSRSGRSLRSGGSFEGSRRCAMPPSLSPGMTGAPSPGGTWPPGPADVSAGPGGSPLIGGAFLTWGRTSNTSTSARSITLGNTGLVDAGGAGAGGGGASQSRGQGRGGAVGALPASGSLLFPTTNGSVTAARSAASTGTGVNSAPHGGLDTAAMSPMRASLLASSVLGGRPSQGGVEGLGPPSFMSGGRATARISSASSRGVPRGRAGAGVTAGVDPGASGAGCGLPAGSNVDLVDALTHRFAGRKDLLDRTFVWIDIFAINQHPNTTQADDLANLQEVVGSSDATLLVLDRSGQVLTRIWCLYEIWQTVRRRGTRALRVLAAALDVGELRRVWGDLDVERAQATVDADRVRILADIRATMGSDSLNTHIKKAIVESATSELASVRAVSRGSVAHGDAALKAASLLRAGGAAREALGAAREAAEAFTTSRGSADRSTLTALRSVAHCHEDLGAHGLALGLLQQQVVPYLELAYGNTHTAYGPLCDVGMLQYKLGQADEAYGTLLRALGCQLRALHANAAHLTMQLGDLLTAVGMGPGQASPQPDLRHHDSPHPGSAASVGPPHRDRTTSGTASGDPYGSSGKVSELQLAERLPAIVALLRSLVELIVEEEGPGRGGESGAESSPAAVEEKGDVEAGGKGGGEAAAGAGGGVAAAVAGGGGSGATRAAVGPFLEDLGHTLNSLGLVQAQRANAGGGGAARREALELMEASVKLLECCGGSDRGMGALDARANLAGLVMDGGDLQAAERLLRTNLALTESVFGRDHPSSATALNNLALCLKRQRSRSDKLAEAEAEALYRRCLALCGAALGEAHPETLVVATNLGVLLAEQRRLSESELLLTRAVGSLPSELPPAHPDVLTAHYHLADVLEQRGRLHEAEAMYGITLQFAESAPPDQRDHGVVLAAREGVERVQALLGGQAEQQGSCCVVS